MRVSVIIPTYNRGYVIAEALQSVFAQTFGDFEVIVVDDDSNDSTAKIVGQFADPRLVYIRHEKNKGAAAATNTGLKSSRGELICFLGSDDLWKEEMLESEVKFLARHPEVQAVFTDVQMIHGAQSVPSVVRTYPVFSRFLANGPFPEGVVLPQREMYLCLLQEMPVKLQAAMLTRKCLEETGGFDESTRCGEDWDVLVRFARKCRFGFIDRPLAIQRIMSDSTLATHHAEDALFMRERFLREKRNLKDDSEARACARRGIAQHSSRLGWWCLAEGRRLDSARAYWTGFLESGHIGLLARVPSAYFPAPLRSLLKRLFGGNSD